MKISKREAAVIALYTFTLFCNFHFVVSYIRKNLNLNYDVYDISQNAQSLKDKVEKEFLEIKSKYNLPDDIDFNFLSTLQVGT
jgi:hypothetical protein